MFITFLSIIYFSILSIHVRHSQYFSKVSNAVIVIVYEDGREADVHIMTKEICEEYWEKWLQRLAEYHDNIPHRQLNSMRGGMQDPALAPNVGSLLNQKNRSDLRRGAKTVTSIGVPLHLFAKVVKDEDIIPEKGILKIFRDLLKFYFMEWRSPKNLISYIRKLLYRNEQK